MSAVLATGAVLGKIPGAAAAEGSATVPALPNGVSDPRVARSFAIRLATAAREAAIPVPPHTTNGDEELYPDKSGTYTKGILQDGIGLVNPQAYRSFRTAINSGRFSDWENIITGGRAHRMDRSVAVRLRSKDPTVRSLAMRPHRGTRSGKSWFHRPLR
jgi:hypothetical protein